MTQSALVGSWYNSGFYGHYRGQFKCELAQDYRLAAKPQPPAVFLQRIKEPPGLHLFSKHDNRGVFDPGIGKRKAWEKLKKKCNVFNWPSDDEAQSPLVSSYQKDYQKESGGIQPLVRFIQSGPPQSLNLNRIPSTTYQHTFCHQLINHLPEEKFKKEIFESKEKLGISQVSESKEKLGISQASESKEKPGISQASESKEKLWISPASSALSDSLPGLPFTVNRKKVDPFLHFTVSDCLRWLDPLKKAH
ncbi:uncharacterized protein C3orf84 homolog [Dromiciops gliroides]|uniref:uncharacterized protein C3orf84 homolog n=1 Tax=Dromiciops gliroides TaxID=33562 RepID=UPI001CC6E45B|nr:uncharacterized protein C3orf84 homolog [Dromiciops gliroides]